MCLWNPVQTRGCTSLFSDVFSFLKVINSQAFFFPLAQYSPASTPSPRQLHPFDRSFPSSWTCSCPLTRSPCQYKPCPLDLLLQCPSLASTSVKESERSLYGFFSAQSSDPILFYPWRFPLCRKAHASVLGLKRFLEKLAPVPAPHMGTRFPVFPLGHTSIRFSYVSFCLDLEIGLFPRPTPHRDIVNSR